MSDEIPEEIKTIRKRPRSENGEQTGSVVKIPKISDHPHTIFSDSHHPESSQTNERIEKEQDTALTNNELSGVEPS